MSEQLRNRILSTLRESDRGMMTKTIGSILDITDHIELSRELGNLRKAGLVLKEKAVWFYNHPKIEPQPTTKEVAPSNIVSIEKDRQPEPSCDSIDKKLDALEVQLSKKAPSHIDRLNIKVRTLNRLSLILDPEIAEVIESVINDLKSIEDATA